MIIFTLLSFLWTFIGKINIIYYHFLRFSNCLIDLIRLLFPFIGHTEADAIKPLSEDENRLVGDAVTLSCSYKDYTSTVQNLQWYRQYPRSKPEFLLYIFPSGVMSEDRPDRFSAKVHQDIKQVDLKISSAVQADSAVYYCALVPTVTGNLTVSYKNLPLH